MCVLVLVIASIFKVLQARKFRFRFSVFALISQHPSAGTGSGTESECSLFI